MPQNPQHALRRHVLYRLMRLTPESFEPQDVEYFVQDRAAVIEELCAIVTPWTQEEQNILAAAMQHTQGVMADLERLHGQLARRIGCLGTAGLHSQRSVPGPASRLSKRY